MTKFSNTNIAIIGLGYVGLPLAVEFSKKIKIIGFDINKQRVEDLKNGVDKTLEIESKILLNQIKTKRLKITNIPKDIYNCQYYIITVPTPVDKNNKPDFYPLIKASELVGKNLKEGDIVIYESTVYPGATEEICVPILEKNSNLIYNNNFFVGYSPERINPGDKQHTLTRIVKVTSGSNIETANLVDNLYKEIIVAGTYKASSIKVAEAAKVIENSQRDINIAFVNELSKIFNLLEIDTDEVLKAAGTKWNFLNFKPGLVGGHCIGVDPFYLAQKAQEIGYHPEIILAGRRLNDSMGKYIASETIKEMIKKDIDIKKSKILVLGFTFKENCPDFRNTRVIDIINELNTYSLNVTIVDPWPSINEIFNEYNTIIYNEIPKNIKFDAIIVAVGHHQFRNIQLKEITKTNCVIFDVKSIFDKNDTNKRL
jgi:UDP-N-acetyl-D-galactosamine dehydrogenase